MVRSPRKLEIVLNIVALVILMIIVSRLPKYFYGDYIKHTEPIGIYNQMVFIGGGKLGPHAYYVSKEDVNKIKSEQNFNYWLIPVFVAISGMIIYNFVKLKKCYATFDL